MSDQTELERLSELLPRLAMAVIFQCMRSPDGIAIDKPHLRHAWLIAKSVERIADANGYWTQQSSQALLDMRQAMIESLRLLHGQERGVPPDWNERLQKIADEHIHDRLEIEAGSDLATQLQQAILIDFYGPAERLQRLLGLSDADEDELFDALEPDVGIAELLRPAHRRARTLLQLVEERYGSAPPEAVAELIARVRQALKEMESWSR